MYSYVICMSLVCTGMSSVCHSYVLVCYPYVTRMSLACTGMSSVCHSYVLVFHPYVTLMYSYVIRMSLVCGFTMNLRKHSEKISKNFFKHGNLCIEYYLYPQVSFLLNNFTKKSVLLWSIVRLSLIRKTSSYNLQSQRNKTMSCNRNKVSFFW